MDELSKEYVISFYDKAFQMFGDRPEAVRWTSRGQRLRYECLLAIDDNLDGKKILDYGCGKGDFYEFLKEKDISVHYTGFDINEKLISLAKQKFPECKFRVFDMVKDELDEDFDYIILCGVFNLNVAGIAESITRTLTGLFQHCRSALAFNALSRYEPKKGYELHYVSPTELFDFAVNNLSPFVSLIHDRIPYDFTLLVRKQAKI